MRIRILSILVFGLLLFSSATPLLANENNLKENSPENINLVELTLESYNMIIIAPTCYDSTLESFIEHKNNRNIITKFISINDIYSGKYFEVKGRDDPEKIKYFIKDAIENWNITYVLFVGSYQQIPIRYCYNNDNYSNYPELKFISEPYYADIYDDIGDFSSWDSDNDGIFGEWNGEVAEDQPIDLKPDVCLGRLTCINKREVKIVVNKIINYENKPADLSWFKRMVVVGGDTYDEFVGNEGEIYNQMAVDAMEGFTPIKLWASTGELKNGWDIVREINKGCGFLYLSGHGSTNVWVTYTPGHTESAGRFGTFNTLFLYNQHKLPVCLVGGCHNSEFAIGLTGPLKYLYFLAWMTECWSWQFVSRPYGGSIATIGSTGLCWYGVEYGGGGSDWLNIQFFKEYANYNFILGQIWKNALTLFLETFPIDWNTPSGGVSSIDAKTVQEWTLLGDPSLKIGGYEEVVIKNG